MNRPSLDYSNRAIDISPITLKSIVDGLARENRAGMSRVPKASMIYWIYRKHAEEFEAISKILSTYIEAYEYVSVLDEETVKNHIRKQLNRISHSIAVQTSKLIDQLTL